MHPRPPRPPTGLFNVTVDPCEYTNLAAEHPDIVADIVKELAKFQATAVPPVKPDGCHPNQVPVPGGGHAWQPCDAPKGLTPVV